MTKPYDKIILISLDTLRSDCIQANPYKLFPNSYKTTQKLKPNKLDELVKKASFFPNTISVAPYTSASHAAYFSGKWQRKNGIYDQFNSKLKSKTIFDIAKHNGYNTIFKTDFPLVLGKYLNFLNGVDDYFIEDESSALAQLKKHDKSFAFFHFGQIHYPYGFHSLKYGGNDYENKVIELEKKYNIDHDTINLEDMAVESFRDEKDLELLYRYKAVVAYMYANKMDNELFDLYLEGINYFHEHLFNAFIEKLQKSLEGQRYLIVIFGDHGEAWTDQTYGHHNSTDEGVIRVPLLFYGTDIPEGVIQSDRVRTIDLFPTLLGAMGSKDDVDFDGTDLNEYLSSNKALQLANRDAFSAVWVNELKDILEKTDSILEGKELLTDSRQSIKYSACMYMGNYKYLQYYKNFAHRSEKLEEYKATQLFDMSDIAKPIEVDIESHKDVVAEMDKKLQEMNDMGLEQNEVSDQLREYFKIQGYNV
jgi:choline-sulfatase